MESQCTQISDGVGNHTQSKVSELAFIKYQMIWVFNTPYIYINQDNFGLYVLDQRKDHDLFIYLPHELWNFISLTPNVASVVMQMDALEKGSYAYLMMENFVI